VSGDKLKLMEFKCECDHLACGHPPGDCGNRTVKVERPLGVPTALCDACADRWGFGPVPLGKTSR
jgi:hypothetical protein